MMKKGPQKLRQRFDLNRQPDSYLAWYKEIYACGRP